ncbi:MAG: hypothetical protein WC648_00125 [Candidatus Paceibacterota bacterium]|jgi:hypothetical protein
MKYKVLAVVALGLLIQTTAVSANTIDITMIAGTGIQDDGWTAATSQNGIQLGLRARYAYVGGVLANDGNGTYTTTPGFAPAPHGSQAKWNYDMSVSNPSGLGSATYYISVDTDGGVAYNPLTFLVAAYGDNSYGTAATPNGGGIEGSFLLHVFDTVMQNSQNITFFPQSLYGLDPSVPGTYGFELFAVPFGAGPDATRLASVGMTVQVGDGRVPDHTTTGTLLAGSMLGLVYLSRKTKQLA